MVLARFHLRESMRKILVFGIQERALERLEAIELLSRAPQLAREICILLEPENMTKAVDRILEMMEPVSHGLERALDMVERAKAADSRNRGSILELILEGAHLAVEVLNPLHYVRMRSWNCFLSFSTKSWNSFVSTSFMFCSFVRSSFNRSRCFSFFCRSCSI
jgi:hypothetical protein